MAESEAKRAKPVNEAEIAAAAAEPAATHECCPVDLSQYTATATGWYLSNQDPDWQYQPVYNVLYHASSGCFYQPAADGQLQPCTLDLETGAVTVQPTAAAWPDWCACPQLKVTADLTAMQGNRPTQEDRHTLLGSLALPANITPACFYAIFDGHLGADASQYAADHLASAVEARLKALAAHTLDDDQVTAVLVEAFEEVDRQFLRLARIRKRRDGSCALVALLLGRKLFTAHLGDSRAVLCRRGNNVLQLTQDHKPERESERARIEAAGGFVLNVNGVFRTSPISEEEIKAQQTRLGNQKPVIPLQLAVARSFGDLELKQPKALVTSRPEVGIYELEPSDCYVLLGCDGVYDVCSNQDVVDIVARARQKAGLSPDTNPFFSERFTLKQASGAVVNEAYHRGSSDNISVLCIGLDWEAAKSSE